MDPLELKENLIESGQFIESLSGNVWRIKVIEAGESKNGNVYSAEVLREAAHLFNGVGVHGYGFKQSWDHLPDNVKDRFPGGFANAVLGVLQEATFDEGLQAVTAKLVLAENKLSTFVRDTAKSLWEKVKSVPVYGFSIDAAGRGIKEAGKMMVQAITGVNHLDLVTSPAAGGEFLAVVESYAPEAEPEHEPEENQVTESQEGEPKMTDKNKAPEFDSEGASKMLESLQAQAEATEKKLAELAVKEAEADKKAWRNEALERINKTGLKESADFFKEGILARFPDRPIDYTEFDGVVKEAAELIDKANAKTPEAAGIEVGDNVETWSKGLAESMSGRGTFTFDNLASATIGKPLTNDNIKEAVSTADFTNTIARTQNRRVEEFSMNREDNLMWLIDFVRVLRNDHTVEVNPVDGNTRATTVTDGAAYPLVSAPTDRQITYSPSVYGKIIQFTKRMLLRDDVGLAARLIDEVAYSVWSAHDNYVRNTLVTDNPNWGYDSNTLAHATAHGFGDNTSTNAISAAELAAALEQMVGFTHTGTGDAMGWRNAPRHIMVTSSLIADIMNILYPPPGSTTANTMIFQGLFGAQPAPGGVVSAPGSLPSGLHINHQDSDTNDWWLFSDKSAGGAEKLEMGYMQDFAQLINGVWSPKVDILDDPQMGAGFTADVVLSSKCNFGFGGVAVNARGFFGGIVA